MAVNTKVYGPEVRGVLERQGAEASVAEGSPPRRSMRPWNARCEPSPRILLYPDYPERPEHDYITMLGLVVRSVAALDFLLEGQLDQALTQAETPFERLFQRLADLFLDLDGGVGVDGGLDAVLGEGCRPSSISRR